MKIRVGVLCGAMVLAHCGAVYAQAKAPVAPSAMTDEQIADTQAQLIKLLRVSPVLTEVVERDPSLLADQAYVNRTNPQLAEFLVAHPEVVRNPEFFLFNGIEGGRGGRRYQVLEHKVWPEQSGNQETALGQVVSQSVLPFVVFVCILSALLWLLNVFMENRRWSRTIKLQVDAHSRLIERFSSNQELLVYMETEAGKKFLESGPVQVEFAQMQRMPNAVARVLTPLQIGVVMTLLGAGFLMLRHSVYQARVGFLVTGIVIMMPGLGFILSAGLTWLLAGRLGMIPGTSATTTRDRM